MAPDLPIQTMRLAHGGDLAFRTAGDVSQRPAVVLIHGVPNASGYFRGLMEPLLEVAFVVAPDLPGSGASDPLDQPTFKAFADCIEELLDRLGVGERYLYVHDFGAPVALDLAMRAPELVSGLIVQNGNAHRSGMGPNWADVIEFWSAPDARNTAAATAHLTAEGTRGQYADNVPEDLVARLDPARWEEDWRVMNLPGRMETQKAMIADYGNHVARFGEIAAYLKQHQPPGLILWGRHDPYFETAEVLSWLEDLPRAQAHVLDAGHLLLETHAEPAARLIVDFVRSA
ncbi:alpha/beta hydrolase [Caulobacter sp.]|uniref:alpha/beta fold hydrolase n=1 Tax=Caulobacter sp. TaxID=78 RepID=UPI001B261958|nr:alpha/beta hydrolase [Caulobacter sp.]MBO9543262.1 alpha/beta hydrolase [Caulobacter sp.]